MTAGSPLNPGDKWPEKAYKNSEFLASHDARPIRVLCEFLEPERRFRELGVKSTIVFFGSARTLPHETAKHRLKAAREDLKRASEASLKLEQAVDKAECALRLSRYYEDATVLAEKLTRWWLSRPKDACVICSGGGPGIMEAANLGAAQAGGPSAGLNISLPFEQVPNTYQTRELSFEFHYFFIRKFWFVYLAKALVVFPGGFGTFDELFELLTLTQTGKLGKRVPIVIYGTEYWNDVIDFDAMARWGMISEEDLKLFRFCDDVDTAFDYLTKELDKT